MKNKTEYINKVDTILENRSKISYAINKKQKELSIAKENNEFAEANLETTKLLLKATPEDRYTNPDPYFDAFINSAAPIIDSELYFSGELAKRAEESQLNDMFLNATTSGSYSTAALSDIGSVYFDAQREKPEFKAIEAKYKAPKPIERKSEIANKLNEVSPMLKKMFVSAWQAFLDESKERDIIYSAHAMREVLSAFLHILAPDKKVKSKVWCEFDEKGNPTQKTRVRFAIFGNREHYENDFIFKPVKDLMKQEGILYQKLNKYAHFRKDQLPLNYRTSLEIYLATLQNIIGSILDKREKFYFE